MEKEEERPRVKFIKRKKERKKIKQLFNIYYNNTSLLDNLDETFDSLDEKLEEF